MDTVVSTPAVVGDGLGKAKEAVSSAGELLESIPRAVEEIPVEVCACACGGLRACGLAYGFFVVWGGVGSAWKWK